MEIRTSEETIENVLNFSKAYLNLLKQKKALDDDIKALKQDWKEEGVAVGKVVKVLNKIKKELKQSDSDKFEEDVLEEKLLANTTIQDTISILNSKS